MKLRPVIQEIEWLVFYLVLGMLHNLTIEKELLVEWIYSYPITFLCCSNSAVFSF